MFCLLRSVFSIVLWCWLSVASLAALAIDGTPVSGVLIGAAGTTVASAAFTNSNSNAIVVAMVTTSNSFPVSVTVSSIAGGGLTWARHGSSATNCTTSVFNVGNVEVWWALAATALTAQVVTATLSAASTSAVISVFAVSGANTSTPFDIAAPIGNTDCSGSSTNPAATITTTSANTVIFGVVASPGNPASAFTEQSGFTRLTYDSGFSGSPNFNAVATQAERQIVSSTQSSLSVGFATATTDWIMVVDAIKQAGGAAITRRGLLLGVGP